MKFVVNLLLMLCSIYIFHSYELPNLCPFKQLLHEHTCSAFSTLCSIYFIYYENPNLITQNVISFMSNPKKLHEKICSFHMPICNLQNNEKRWTQFETFLFNEDYMKKRKLKLLSRRQKNFNFLLILL